MQLEKVTKMRYLKVLQGLKEDYVIKTILSALAGLWFTVQDMFFANGEFMLLLLIVIFVDFITGNINARRKKLPILSIGWRQTVSKTVEYVVFILILTGISNTFSSVEGSGWVAAIFEFTKNIELFGYFFIIFTELKSITENLTGDDNTIQKLFKKISDRINKHV